MEVLRSVDANVLPYRPKVIAYYAGSNDVASFRAHLLHRLAQRALGDLLQLVIDREDDGVALHRRAARRLRRLEASPMAVAHGRRGARYPAEERVERELDPVHRRIVVVHTPDDATRSFGKTV